MNGAKFGQGLGCLAVFGAIGAITAVYLVIKAIVWAVKHISINF